MADPSKLLTPAGNDAQVVYEARETVWRSRKLLKETEPLVTQIEGAP